MLLLAFVLQPVMAAYGQLHETLTHPGDGIAHVDGDLHGDADADAQASPEGERQDGSILHTLLHHAHCCAQPQWLAPDGLPLSLCIASAARPPASGYDAPAESRADTPFRPPIAA